jgi:hypothetical protein
MNKYLRHLLIATFNLGLCFSANALTINVNLPLQLPKNITTYIAYKYNLPCQSIGDTSKCRTIQGETRELNSNDLPIFLGIFNRQFAKEPTAVDRGNDKSFVHVRLSNRFYSECDVHVAGLAAVNFSWDNFGKCIIH